VDEAALIARLVELVSATGFGLVLRASPLLRDIDVFEQRCVGKRWRERWPMVTLAES
jgi:hypothetical protein